MKSYIFSRKAFVDFFSTGAFFWLVCVGIILVTRVPFLLSRQIIFQFDQAKDSLAILDIVVTHDVKLVGPWTSIPGVYFGPGWYYLLAPGYAITQGDPVSAVWTMVGLILIQLILIARTWGKRTALVFVLAPLYYITSTSAWNPFPMTLITFFLLAISWHAYKSKILKWWQWLLFGFLAGMGFHFSAAFAPFYLPYILIVALMTAKTKLDRARQLILTLLGTSIAFVPQILFELSHSFSQSKALLSYFTAGESQQFGFNKMLSVIHTIIGETRLAVIPDIPWLTSSFSGIFLSCFALFLLVITIHMWRTSTCWQKKWLITTIIFLTILPTIGFFFLHFNVWYVYGMAPVFTVIVGLWLNTLNKKWVIFYFSFTSACFLIWIQQQFSLLHTLTLNGDAHMLATKEQTIDKIYEIANGQSFSLYTYKPDIYDFEFQYLVLRLGLLRKQKVPVDFAYEPHVISYISQKSSFLSKVEQQAPPIQRLFFVVEESGLSDFQSNWWARQLPHRVVSEFMMGNDLKLIEAVPASPSSQLTE